MCKQVVVMRGFYTDVHVINRLIKLKSELDSQYDFFFLYDQKPNKTKLADIPTDISVASFHQDNWVDYKTPDPYNKTFIPGNEETMFIMFQEQHPQYEYYWFIEYDVDYSGNWLDFFCFFTDNKVDLLTTTLVKYDEFPNWGMWKSLTPPMSGGEFKKEDKLLGFFPVCRFSNTSLLFIKERLAQGWSGHPEALIATLLRANGFSIEDIGGEGSFVSPENKGKHYTNDRFDEDLKPGTFIFRPKMTSMGTTPNMLWHPVKDDKVKVWDSKVGMFEKIKNKMRKILS